MGAVATVGAAEGNVRLSAEGDAARAADTTVGTSAAGTTPAECPTYPSTDRHGYRDSAAPARISPPDTSPSVQTRCHRGDPRSASCAR